MAGLTVYIFMHFGLDCQTILALMTLTANIFELDLHIFIIIYIFFILGSIDSEG